jgi:hypothetical protein
LGPEALTLRHFLVHTVAGELLNVDGTLWRTMRLLFVRPGRLTLEYVAGRRRLYVNPFRLLLVAIVAYVLITSSGLIAFWSIGPVKMNIAPAAFRQNRSIEATIHEIDRYGFLRRQLAAKQTQLASEAAREQFHQRLTAFAQPLSFANVIFFAAALHLCFRRHRRRFLEHAAFSMHFVSFVLLSSLMLVPAIRFRFWLGGSLYLVMMLIGLWQFAYLTFAIRRFYLTGGRWGGWLMSAAAAVLMYVLNSAFMTAVQVIGAAIALAFV